MFSTVDTGISNLIQDGCSCTLFIVSSVDCSHSRLWALVRVYFTLGKSPVEANSVVVTVCIYIKKCRFKYTCNDDNSIGRKKQQKLAYHVITCKFPITSFITMSANHDIVADVQQGGIFSPALFAVFIN